MPYRAYFPFSLSGEQLQAAGLPPGETAFLSGPAGAGKTTAAVARLLHLLSQGVPAESILIFTPQRTLALPFAAALDAPFGQSGGMAAQLTLGGLARRMLELYWPLAGGPAGFAQPDQAPIFLTLETTQYYMAHLVYPLLESERLFQSVRIERNRLYSQIIDNLNKAAVVGFSHLEIGERLKAAWTGEPGQANVYEDAQRCASLFRRHCLEHNLLDFSLQVEIFRQFIWPEPLCQEYLRSSFQHLIVDNLEEDTPVAHDLLLDWLPSFESALLIYDEEAGYRRFLGADPDGALRLEAACRRSLRFTGSWVKSPPVDALQTAIGQALSPQPAALTEAADPVAVGQSRLALEFQEHRFFPAMLDWVADQIQVLVESGTPPGEIAVLSPFLSDALRFALSHRLEARRIPTRSHRPSRSLREEPVTRCLLTLMMLAHPAWLPSAVSPANFPLLPSPGDIANMLVQSIAGLDPVRAQILAQCVFHLQDGLPMLESFDRLPAETQERITFTFGERYEGLRTWLEAYRLDAPEEPDHFLSRLFGELLSQPGYGFHTLGLRYSAGEITANLMESIYKFRQAAGEALAALDAPLGREYIEMLQDGVIAAQYVRSWQEQPDEAVLLAPAYTFLMTNRPVDVQFWLDTGSRGWAERLYQPLTHPYVLSRSWQAGRIWTDADEVWAVQSALYRLATGLLKRCRYKLYLGLSGLGEQGYEQRGPLLRAFQRTLQGLSEG